jgi:tetratricopeptide (TPR) repeat protein
MRRLLSVGSQPLELYQEALSLWRLVPGVDPMIPARLHGKIVDAAGDMLWVVDRAQYESAFQTASSSRDYLEHNLPAIQSGPPSHERVRLMVTLAWNASRLRDAPDWAAAERYARFGVADAEALDAPEDLSAALASLDATNTHQGRWREHARLAARRMELTRDPRFTNERERASALVGLGKALLSVGEYSEAIPNLREAERISAQLQAVDLQYWSTEVRAYCLFQLNRWPALREAEATLEDLQRRYPPERIGVSCFSLAMFAALDALRGDLDRARAKREESRAIMIGTSGTRQKWERPQYY